MPVTHCSLFQKLSFAQGTLRHVPAAATHQDEQYMELMTLNVPIRAIWSIMLLRGSIHLPSAVDHSYLRVHAGTLAQRPVRHIYDDKIFKTHQNLSRGSARETESIWLY